MMRAAACAVCFLAAVVSCSDEDTVSVYGSPGDAKTEAASKVIPESCDAVKQAVAAEVKAVAKCSGTEACKWGMAGGCSDSPLPCCGLPYAEGADLSFLKGLAQKYDELECATFLVNCCDCGTPAPRFCVAGRCQPE
jgi:hypothetical protein